MLLRIAPDAPEPIYEQIVRQIRAAIASGRVAPGEQVPSHRDLATRLVVNHLTVKRAYELLEREGLLTTRRGLGTFVAQDLPKRAGAAGLEGLSKDLSRTARSAAEHGLEHDGWKRLCEQAWKDSRT